MRASSIKAPDVMGFQHLMTTSLAKLENADELIDLLDRFVASWQELDRWKLKNQSAKSFGPGEPCFHGDAPAIVVATTPIRVSIRKWHVPLRKSEFAMTGDIRWVDPSNLIKAGSKAGAAQWCKAMAMCGQEPEHWSTSAIALAIAQ